MNDTKLNVFHIFDNDNNDFSQGVANLYNITSGFQSIMSLIIQDLLLSCPYAFPVRPVTLLGLFL